MKRDEVSGDEWAIPQERYKTGLGLVVPLSPAGRVVLDKVPKVGKSGFVFTTDDKHPIAGLSKFKRAFDAKVLAELGEQDPEAKPLPNWTLHATRSGNHRVPLPRPMPDPAQHLQRHRDRPGATSLKDM